MPDAQNKRIFDPAATHPRAELPARSAWSALPRLPGTRPQGFMPVEDLLKEMGLARRPAAAPFVAPLPPEQAEFSPPRPLRRAPVRFVRPDSAGGNG